MERVLVTGGAGFIGSHLVELLLDTGATVLVVDDFRCGKREHLADASDRGDVTIHQGDIRSSHDLQIIEDFAPDTVFHMAALHFIPYCDAHPQEAFEVNVLGLDTVIRALRRSPLARFVFPSSGAIYGFADTPRGEDSVAEPKGTYGLSKWIGEQLVARLHADRPGVSTAVARLFNTYGPRETNPHVIPEILAAIRNGEVVRLGNMWPRRDLVFVTDTARGLLAAATANGFNVFNVGTGVGTSIADVVAALEGIRGEPLRVVEDPARIRSDDGHLVADPARIRLHTGWSAAYDLTDGLRELLVAEGLVYDPV